MFAHRGGFGIGGHDSITDHAYQRLWSRKKSGTLAAWFFVRELSLPLGPGEECGTPLPASVVANFANHEFRNCYILFNAIVFSELRLVPPLPAENYMLKIQRSSNGQVIFTLSGQIDEEHIAELETYIRAEANAQSIVLDLKDVTLAGRDAVSFLEHYEAEGVILRNCAAYVREWITRQRHGR
jgi:hypothetical protein